MVSERRISLEDAPIRISYLPLAAYQSCNSVLYHAKLRLSSYIVTVLVSPGASWTFSKPFSSFSGRVVDAVMSFT